MKQTKKEGKVTLLRNTGRWTIHLDQPLGFSSELVLTDKEMETVIRLLESYKLLTN